MDEKQWLVSRLDTATKTIFDEFQLSKEDFIRIREELTFSITTKRNYILSSVVFVSALLTTLYQTYLIIITHFLIILILDLSIGLITFFVASKYVKATKQTFINVENSIVNAQKALNHNFGFLIQNTMELTNANIITIREYSEFLRVLSGIIYIPFSYALSQGSKSRLLDKYYRNSFAEYVKEFERVIESAISIFRNMNKQSIPSQSLDYVTNAITTYRNNQSKPSENNIFNLKNRISTTLGSKELLQIDATVIAGLLILLTIQGASNEDNLSWIDGVIRNEQIKNLENLKTDSTPEMIEKINEEIIRLTIEDQNALTKEKTRQQFIPLIRIVNPAIPFLISMAIFITSAISEAYVSLRHQEEASRVGRITMYMGFVMLLVSTALMVLNIL